MRAKGQSYKANFDINYIKNGLNKLNFTLNYINFDVIYDDPLCLQKIMLYSEIRKWFERYFVMAVTSLLIFPWIC